MAVSKKRAGFHRSDADVCAEELATIGLDQLRLGEEIQDVLLRDLDLAGRTISNLTLTHCVLERVSFGESVIHLCRMRDVRLIGCELANASIRGWAATRVELIDCRITGLKAAECRWQDVLVDSCAAGYAQFNDGQLRSCEFRNTPMVESDFRSATVEGCLFASASLKKADFSGARLAGTDLRGAEIDGLIAGAGDVAGAIVSADQAIGLAHLLGIQIR